MDADRNAALSREMEAALGADQTPFQQVMRRHGLYAPWSGIGGGWVPIVDRLIADLKAMGWRGRVDQVKEKFGGLRFYHSAARSVPDGLCSPCASAAEADSHRAAEELCARCQPLAEASRAEDARRWPLFDARVAEAEREAWRTCELCGRPGRPNRDGWITTLCPEHRRAERARRRARWIPNDHLEDAMNLPSSLPANPAPVDLSGVRAGADRVRLGAPTDHWHLHAVCRSLPTDYEPYGFRVRDDADCSCGCRWFVPLAGKLGFDWGVCANPLSPRVGLLTFEHQGCPAFEAGPDDPAELAPAPDADPPRPEDTG